MRQPIVAANWKMNGTRASATKLVDGILADLDGFDHVEVVICPPFVLIPAVAERMVGKPVKVGGQDLDTHDQGAFTGAVSGDMLKDHGCEYCIVGHSERRTLYEETDDLVALKFAKAQQCGLSPILCIGETLSQRENGQTEAVLARQIDAVVDLCGIDKFADAVLAYEPVWAIGTGRTASPDQAQQAHAFIRGKLSAIDENISSALRIQYGGSVKADNAPELFNQQDVDGGLIGGASLKAVDFLAICRAAL